MNPHRRFKDSIYEQFARIGKAISSPKRLELLDLLCQGPRSVEVLSKESNLTIANTSRHLQVLMGASLIENHKEGLFVVYRIADPAVCEFLRNIRLLAEKRLADINQITDRFLEGFEDLEAVDQEELLERVRRRNVTVIDVRPVEEYRAGHIPGAVSVPLKELESRLTELSRDRDVVAYCRGPYCVMAIRAVELLRSKGYRALRLEEGVHDLKTRGFEITEEENS
jgi:rhodanese-related sulfurtransferase